MSHSETNAGRSEDEQSCDGRGPDSRGVAAELQRAQTTLDFTTGMSLFLVVLIAVLLFIPGELAPFTQGAQENIATANRIGDQLSEGLLGAPSRPHVLNTSCTLAFFRNETPNHGECQFTGERLSERIGVKDRQYVNVTLQANLSANGGTEDVLCWDDNGSDPGKLVEHSNATNPDKSVDCDTRFAIGETPPTASGSTVTARRVVSVNASAGSTVKRDVALVVEVW